ncbi:MAG TPA: choice-of-anchor D domain-containing protein, partial [Candidatus Sumerlaeota bacterium]|nr:choice-of-anchor D domain-containing protein [Candidatus Sumerlaeota bacterium]
MSKVKGSTPILKTAAAFLMLIAAVALWGPQAAQAQDQTTGTGALLVSLDASTLAAGTLAAWENEGSLGGAFTSSTANPLVETVQGVKAVTFGNTWLKSNFLTTDDFTSTSDWTVEIWALNPSVGGDEGMMTWSNRGEDNRNAACCYSTAAGWGAFAGWGPGDIGYKDAVPPTAGIWHHIVYTYAGGANAPLTIYVDGVQNNQGNKSLVIHGPNDKQPMPVILGGSTGGDATGLAANATEQWFTGSISKVRIHGGQLSAAQVKTNYDVEKTAYLASALTVTAPVSGGLYYGAVAVGSESAAQTVTIKNIGTTDLTFTAPAVAITGDAADQYSIVPGFDTTPLAAGATRSVQVTLKPTAAGFKAAQLVFNTNSAVAATPVNLLGGTPTALNTAGDVLVNLKSSALANGALTTWTNEGTLGGQFINPGTAVPTVGSVQGIKSVSFNSTWLKSNFLTTAAFTGNSDWSLETWVYNTAVGGEEQVVTWSNRGEDSQNAAFIYGTASGWGAFGGWGNGDLGFLNAAPPSGGAWHQVAITYAGGANSLLKVYVDGKLNNSRTTSLNIHGVGDGQAMPIILGGSTGDNPNGLNANAEGWWYTGSLATVRFHDNALTPAQVYSNYLFEQPTYSASLQVNITPAEAVTAGVQWRFSTDATGVWRNSGDTVRLPSAEYVIEYKA